MLHLDILDIFFIGSCISNCVSDVLLSLLDGELNKTSTPRSSSNPFFQSSHYHSDDRPPGSSGQNVARIPGNLNLGVQGIV